MADSWTFGEKMSAGFIVVLLLSVVVGGIAFVSLRSTVAAKDRVLDVNARNLQDAAAMESEVHAKSAAARGFLLTKDEKYALDLNQLRENVGELLNKLKAQATQEEERQLLRQIENAEAAHQNAIDRTIAMRRTSVEIEPVVRYFDDEVTPRRTERNRFVESYVSLQERLLTQAKLEATQQADSAIISVVVTIIAAILLAVLIATTLTRTLTRQLGSAVQHIQSSSAELQTAANQQATGTREQASAMTEITTTINELLVTARQIAESAQRVSQIAAQTASTVKNGDQGVQRSQESIAAMRKQIDLVVSHMLDLGKKSQQIGGVLEVINELSEQTNILAINATIEAAGAGDAGKRFGIVADEIRKLADRVGGSTKEIRILIDDVRGAVNKTVMATEGGSKAVDASARQFSEMAVSFSAIGSQVVTTTDAAREIELSTKQQATAVEQVNQAVANVAQAVREMEATSNQTSQTASELTRLSRELSRLIQRMA